MVPPKILRLALIGKEITQAFNFDPEGDTIPVLYDQYDKLAENYWNGVKDDYARLFEFLHPIKKGWWSVGRAVPKRSELPRFSQVAFLVQMPHMDLYKEFPKADRSELKERAAYAKRWLELYAPEKFVFKLHDSLPEAAKNLASNQKEALAELASFIESKSSMPSGEELHAKLHERKEFKAVYLAFFGKDHGPKAGWFLSSLPRDFVLTRLKEASA